LARFLTDTHTLIWWWNEDERLSESARTALVDRRNEIFASCVNAWEIANKVRIGKLPEMAPFVTSYNSLVVEDGFVHLDLRHEHALEAGLFPGTHRDPFDRLIAAQALAEDCVVITRDREFGTFGCKVLW
jgi:PIN domain nuclease of toxin-antitoxin system